MDKFLLKKRAREEQIPIKSDNQRQIGEDETISRPTNQFASEEINRPRTSNESTPTHVPNCHHEYLQNIDIDDIMPEFINRQNTFAAK